MIGFKMRQRLGSARLDLALAAGLLPAILLGCGGSEPIKLSSGNELTELAAPDPDPPPVDQQPEADRAESPPPEQTPDAARNEAGREPGEAPATEDLSSGKRNTPDRPVAAGSANGTAGSTRETATAVNERPIELTFEDLKFDIEPGDPFDPEMLPERVTKYFGRRIRIRGYILPSFRQSGLTQFVLVRDNMECCFGPGAALYDCIRVEMVPGKATNFSIRPVAVEGIFKLEEFFGPDDTHLAIYYLTGEEVR